MTGPHGDLPSYRPAAHRQQPAPEWSSAGPDVVGTGTVGPIDCTDAALVVVVPYDGTPRVYRAAPLPPHLAAELLSSAAIQYAARHSTDPSGGPT